MVVTTYPNADFSLVADVLRFASKIGEEAHLVQLDDIHYVVVANSTNVLAQGKAFESMLGVESVHLIDTPYQLAARQIKPRGSCFKVVDGWNISDPNISVIAGPCSVESEEQIILTAMAVSAAGATALRGGAFKPRTSCYSFQGLAEEGLRLLQLAKRETGLPIVSEILDLSTLDLHADLVDVIQIGARSMQNFPLLRAVGQLGKPVLLKRGMMATVDELLQSAEYILAAGNSRVILCERGIRTFETSTRNTLDLNSVVALKEKTHLPVFVDPSHGTGDSKYVPAMSRAAIACGADGLLIEVHNNPISAISDGQQSLHPAEYTRVIKEVSLIAGMLGRKIDLMPKSEAIMAESFGCSSVSASNC